MGSIVILVPTYRALNPTFFLDFMFFCIIFFYNSAFILLYSLISFKIMSRIINFDQTKENPTFSFSLSNISWYAGSLCVIIPLVIINVLLMGNAFRLLENLNMKWLTHHNGDVIVVWIAPTIWFFWCDAPPYWIILSLMVIPALAVVVGHDVLTAVFN